MDNFRCINCNADTSSKIDRRAVDIQDTWYNFCNNCERLANNILNKATDDQGKIIEQAEELMYEMFVKGKEY